MYTILMAALVRVDPNSSESIVAQVVGQLRVLLVEGTLKPGTPLPPVRRLAIDLAVHFNTVAEAYRQLAAEGWLDLRHGRGAVVIERQAPSPSSREVATYRNRLRELVSQMRARGISAGAVASELRALAQNLTTMEVEK